MHRLVLCDDELRLAVWLLQQETAVNHWKRKRMGFSRCISTPKANFWLQFPCLSRDRAMIKTANRFLPVEATSLHCLHSVLTCSLSTLLSYCSSALVSEKYWVSVVWSYVPVKSSLLLVVEELYRVHRRCAIESGEGVARDLPLLAPGFGLHPLTLSWPAGHICPAGHERVKVLMPTNPKRLSLYDVVITTDITANTIARRQ
jgi:hypothetical protein